jgi:hypothetical protein
MLFTYPKSGHSLERDFKWLGSHRYGILHLGGRDAHDLRQRCEAASAILGWPAPYTEHASDSVHEPQRAPMGGLASVDAWAPLQPTR